MTPDELRRLADEATPGPWRLETRSVPNKNEAVVWNGQGQAIAHDLHDDDARLIALAPDLARLCAEMATWLQRYADAEDWHAYVGADGERIDPEVDAILAKLSELKLL